MNILLSWKLAFASILFLIDFSSASELELLDPLTDSTSSVARNGKPLPINISSIQFESVCVNIYDSQTSLRNKKIYFYSPIAQLNHLNVATILTNTQTMLSIGFKIWSQDVTDKVAQHLTQFLNQQIELDQVKVYPFDSARLTSKVQSVDFSLTDEWIAYKNHPTLRLTLICPTKEDCDRMKTQMRVNPQEFKHLRLEFNPKINDDSCFNNGLGISQEDFTQQVKEANQELFANFEAKLAEELNAFRKVASENLEMTRRELAQTKADLTTKLNLAQKELDLTRNELLNTKSIVNDLMTKLNEGFINNLNFSSTSSLTSEMVDIGQMPTSCSDLERMGHKLSGFFSVKGSKKMEMVYCNFFPNQNDKEKWIGFADVKSAPVHFYVQRNFAFNTKSTPMPFDLARVNEGNAMDLTTGKFTAPRPGIYFFSFAGLAYFPLSSSRLYLHFGLYLNGDVIGSAHVDEANTVDGQHSPLTLQSTLTLKKGDQIWLQIVVSSPGVNLHDNRDWHFTHFTGFLLEEDIVASL